MTDNEEKELRQKVRLAEKLIRWFVERCDCGQVRSNRTYSAYEAFLSGDEHQAESIMDHFPAD